MGGGMRFVMWQLATTWGLTVFELADGVFEVSNLVAKVDNGVVCIIFDFLYFVILSKNLVVCIIEFSMEMRDLLLCGVNVMLERPEWSQSSQLGFKRHSNSLIMGGGCLTERNIVQCN
jgi:hypothetical protein